jgi:hypothetical protein
VGVTKEITHFTDTAMERWFSKPGCSRIKPKADFHHFKET